VRLDAVGERGWMVGRFEKRAGEPFRVWGDGSPQGRRVSGKFPRYRRSLRVTLVRAEGRDAISRASGASFTIGRALDASCEFRLHA